MYQALKASISFAFLRDDSAFTGHISRPVAYIPTYSTVLISEPDHDRIGIYNAKSLEFKCWLEHPNKMKGTAFNTPNAFIHHKNGDFFILEESQINILNGNFAPLQKPILGHFVGMSKGPNGEILAFKIAKGP